MFHSWFPGWDIEVSQIEMFNIYIRSISLLVTVRNVLYILVDRQKFQHCVKYRSWYNTSTCSKGCHGTAQEAGKNVITSESWSFKTGKYCEKCTVLTLKWWSHNTGGLKLTRLENTQGIYYIQVVSNHTWVMICLLSWPLVSLHS